MISPLPPSHPAAGPCPFSHRTPSRRERPRSTPRLHPAALALANALLTLCAVAQTSPDPRPFWHQWRGPDATGVAPLAHPPVQWSESRNIRWKLPLTGKAHASPIVWSNHVYLAGAIPVGTPSAPVYDNAPGSHDNVGVTHRHQFVVLAVRRDNGSVEWSRTVREDFPHEGGHNTGSLANNSPITDGRRIYAFFGSRGLHALRLDGTIDWQKDLGRMQTHHAHGEGSSPALHDNILVVNWDHEAGSFIAAFDARTGRELWRTARDEITSWSTPLIVPHGTHHQVITSATKRIRSYELASGQLLWECAGLSRNVVASPVAANGLVFAGNSYDWQALLAIRLENARGDITGTDRVAWQTRRLTPYVPSPLLYNGTLYLLRHNQNILSGFEPATGRPAFDPVRVGNLRDIFASPVAADGRIYITSREGSTVVLASDPTQPPLATNQLNDTFSASAALAGNELYLRGERHLYCIAEDPPKR